MVIQSVQTLKRVLETVSFQESFGSQMHKTLLILARISRANLIIRVLLKAHFSAWKEQEVEINL
ncbi:hypothetical protein H5410_024388 [Solanum commersonii]|uniref:Uncharacterized protein n=1 Tax=Solanum commersonii TaxID=4109 RepID=A0A9J5ZLU4_SOLCO|nr:hypothetical protein H5410_024388 [Solanum commersonii]